jgi:hypothetical protein
MKPLLLSNKIFVLIFSLFILDCNHRNDTVHHTKKLEHNLGIVDFELPVEFDTMYKWYQQTDSKCTDHFKFRIGNSKYSLPRETGFINDHKVDSLNQFTVVEHNLGCNSNDREIIYGITFEESQKQYFEIHSRLAKSLGKNSKLIFAKLDSAKINKIRFNVSEYEIFNGNLKDYEVSYSTYIKNQPIDFEGKCLAKNCEKFKRDFKKAMESLSITP